MHKTTLKNVVKGILTSREMACLILLVSMGISAVLFADAITIVKNGLSRNHVEAIDATTGVVTVTTKTQKPKTTTKKKAKAKTKAKAKAKAKTTTTTTETATETETPIETTTTVEEYSSWGGEVLDPVNGKVYGPSGYETFYNLDMSGVIAIMADYGYDYSDYWVREDGVKMLGGYIMCAADLSIRPRGSLVETTLGTAIVCDTGEYIYADPMQLDIATTW